jgi:GMP synthase (glutamine-hydrolysing)
MHIHYLQHVPFEGLGSMESWFRERNHGVSATHLYRGETPPGLDQFDWLVVMGGPMGVGDEQQYPWLTEEKHFIRKAIETGKIVLGVCLGAQLIANVLGAPVTRNRHREIGWFPLSVTQEALNNPIGKILSGDSEVFHWHGDTFAIPTGAISLASSTACANQGFVYARKVVGFQFHLETTETSARDLINYCSDELDGSEYVQSAQQMLEKPFRFTLINQLMGEILAAMEKM